MIEVRSFTHSDSPAFRQFLHLDARTLIYASLEYRAFLCSVVPGEPACLLAIEDDRIVGSLPYFRLDAPGVGAVINSLPWYGSHGGCTLLAQSRCEARQALLERFLEIGSEPDVLSATVTLSHVEQAFYDQYRSILKPQAVDSRIGQVTELPPEGDGVESRLDRAVTQKTRNLIRKSLRQGFSSAIVDEEWAWKFLYDTHADNMAAMAAKAKPWEHFLALRKTIPEEARALWIATCDGEPVAGLLLLYFNRTVEYFTPVVKQEFRPRQPLSFLIYQAMRDAVRKGYRWWNWGGTWASQESLHHFKAGWGARDYPYSYLVTTSETGKSVLKAHKDRLPALFPYYYVYPYSQLE